MLVIAKTKDPVGYVWHRPHKAARNEIDFEQKILNVFFLKVVFVWLPKMCSRDLASCTRP